MAYVLISRDGMVERRADTAEGALRAFVEFRRAHDRPSIHDGEDQRVPLLGLLANAFWDVRGEGPHQQLIATLADYVETALNPWMAPLDRPLDGYWRFAGASWALDFEAPIPEAVIDELHRRHPDAAELDELRVGVNKRLPQYLVLPRVERGRWGVWDRQTGKYAELDGGIRRLEGTPDVARAQAKALNAGRPWTDRDQIDALATAMGVDLGRREARASRSAATTSSPAATELRRRPGRRP